MSWRSSAIIINTARGGLVDESALFNALRTRMTTGGADIDTFEVEPPDLETPLLSLPNIVVSPHSAALSEEAAMRMGVVAAKNVVAGLYDQLDPELVFNRRAGDSIFQAAADYTWDRERDWQAGFQINLVDYPLRFIVPGNWPRDRFMEVTRTTRSTKLVKNCDQRSPSADTAIVASTFNWYNLFLYSFTRR